MVAAILLEDATNFAAVPDRSHQGIPRPAFCLPLICPTLQTAVARASLLLEQIPVLSHRHDQRAASHAPGDAAVVCQQQARDL